MGWEIIGQSQNKMSIYYTMRKVEELNSPQINGGGSSSGDELPVAKWPVESE